MANLDDCPAVDGATPPPRARKRRGDRDQRRPSSWRGESDIRPCPLSPATSAGGCHYRACRNDGRGAASTQKVRPASATSSSPSSSSTATSSSSSSPASSATATSSSSASSSSLSSTCHDVTDAGRHAPRIAFPKRARTEQHEGPRGRPHGRVLVLSVPVLTAKAAT